jgi:hypothetical protein
MTHGPSTHAVLQPLALTALALLILNDHVFKPAYGGWWTGKLSDVAGLAVFPLLVSAGGQLIGLWPGGMRTVTSIAVATGIAFVAVKLCTPAGDSYRVGLATLQWPARALAALAHGDALPRIGRVQLVADASDLLALPALLVGPLMTARAAHCTCAHHPYLICR